MLQRRVDNETQMLELGAQIAKILRRGDTVFLTGGLGAGKTTFSRGLITRLSGADEVPSPTYTLVQTYEAPDFEIWHCDLYRLDDSEEIWELGLIDALDDIVALMEWPDRMGHLAPENRLNIHIEFSGSGRLVTISGSEGWEARVNVL